MSKLIICCKEDLLCDGMTTTCPICGTDYNWNGDKLAPREQWGYDTGEQACDILNNQDDDRMWDETGW